MKFARKNYERQTPRKTTHQNRNQHKTKCPFIKSQSVLKTLDFKIKFVQNDMNDKILKKKA